ncbi:MAG: LysR family transcriptional regulator [Acetobacteraceae bacterium]
MDRIDELAVLVAILDAGSLQGAARRLHRSPPAVTRSLAALERRVGTSLLQRTTRRLAATEAGQLLADRARRLLGEFDALLRAGAETGAAIGGLLRLSAPVVFGRLHIVPLLAGFLDAHPGVRAELILSDRYLDLIEEGLDVALRIGPLPDSGLMARRVGQVRRVLVASPAYLAAHGTPVTPGDLARHAIVYTTTQSGPVAWRFRLGGRERAIRLTPRLSVNQVEAALDAARQGQGIASALSYQVAEDLAGGGLVRLLRAVEPAALPVRLVWQGGVDPPARARRFVDHAVRGLAALPILAEP